MYDTIGIEFDNPMRSFFPGQVLSGKICVTCSSAKKCQGIKVKLLGEANVNWTETRTVTTGTGSNQTTSTVTESFKNSETYLKIKFYAVGNGRSTTAIPAGRTEYPFSFVLPHGLPSSFVSLHGNVTYTIEAVMKKAWNFDKKTRVPFTVNALVDLNNDHRAQLPAELRKMKTIGMLCCASGDIAFTVKTAKSGFVPGEMLAVDAEIKNESSKGVNCIVFSLIQVRKYHATSKSRTDTTVIATCSKPGADPYQTEVQRGPILQIPAVPPSGLGNCKIIEVDYMLHVELTIPGPHVNLRGDIPVVIGTIPLRQNFVDLMPSAPYPTMHRSSTMPEAGHDANIFAPTAPSLPGDDYPELPPPTYEDALRYDPVVGPSAGEMGFINGAGPSDDKTDGAGDYIGDDYSSGNFVPKYATWGFKKSQSMIRK